MRRLAGRGIHYLLNRLAELAVRTKTAVVVLARLNGVVSASLRHAGFFCEQGRATAGRVAEWGSHAEAFHWRAGGVRSANARRTPVAARRMREMGCGDASWRGGG